MAYWTPFLRKRKLDVSIDPADQPDQPEQAARFRPQPGVPPMRWAQLAREESVLGRRRGYAQLEPADEAEPRLRPQPVPSGQAAGGPEYAVTDRPLRDVLRVSRETQQRLVTWTDSPSLRADLSTRGWRWQVLWWLLGAAVTDHRLVRLEEGEELRWLLSPVTAEVPLEMTVRLWSPRTLLLRAVCGARDESPDLRLFLQRRLGQLFSLDESTGGMVVRLLDPSQPLLEHHLQLLQGAALYFLVSRQLERSGASCRLTVEGGDQRPCEIDRADWIGTWSGLMRPRSAGEAMPVQWREQAAEALARLLYPDAER